MMNLDKVFVVDIECDGLLDTLTKLHVLSACYYSENNKWEIISTNDSARIQNLVGNPDNVIVGHNFIGYDKPALEKLGYEFKAQVIDTLGLSWYLYNEHLKHGLESWGERFGVPKPEIEDWENLTYEDYKHRCEEDVKINTNLWVKMLALLTELYEDRNAIISVVKYFTFKMECLRYQEENKVLIDIEKCKENLGILESIIEDKNEQLKKVMPKVPKYSIRKKPANPFKKDGSLSAAGERWFDLLEKANLPSDYDGELKEVVKYDDPNPASDQQMKDYLTSLGWTPKFFKDGANGKVPQLRDDDKNLCPNIQKLIAIKPELEALDGLSVASHRAGYLKAFLKYADKDGYAIARCNGFAKTIRLKHSNPFVNLPKPTAQYGEYVRSVMIAPPGKVLIGSDVSSLEDKTKQIAIYSYDPKYVEQMNVKGWDAHLDIGERSGLLNSEEIKFFKWFKSKDKKQEDCPDIYSNFSEEALEKEFVRLSKKRAVAKTVNYACLPQDNTEVLTKYGWKFVDDLSIDDEVLTYNSELDKTEFSPIRYIHKYKDAEVTEMSDGFWSIESTPNHRWIGVEDGSSKFVFKQTYEISDSFSILVSSDNETNFKSYVDSSKITKKFSRVTDVFCLTVDNGTFLIRQNNTITITGNCTYGAGAAKIAESAGIPQKEASGVVKAYWERNWSVKQYAEDRETKQADGKTWVYNPYSKLWLYLTSEHIKFSACNQNAGVKMFDLWIYFMINEGLKPIAQFHDEVLLCVDEDKAEWAEKTLHKCMENVNNLLGYPIKLEVDVQVGRTYADVH
jgi:hypothetical protein